MRGERRAAILPTAVGGGGAALMLVAALAGADYLNNRNTLPVLVVLLAIPALGFAAGHAGTVLGAAACAALLAATGGVLLDPALAREDWRETARELRGGEAVVLDPRDEVALTWYAPGLRAVPAAGVRELAVVLSDPERDPLPTGALETPPVAGFTLAGTRRRERILIARYRAPAPLPVTRVAVDSWARSRLDPGRGAAGATLLAGG